MSNKKTDKEYAELGRKVTAIFESGALSRKDFFAVNFFRGIVAGAGGVIGATVVIAMLLWLVSLFERVPFVDNLSRKLQTTIEQQ